MGKRTLPGLLISAVGALPWVVVSCITVSSDEGTAHPPADLDAAIAKVCEQWPQCYGFPAQECIDFKNLEHEDAVMRGCGNEWSALTTCNATYPFGCGQSFSDYCIEQKVASDRCDNPENCSGYGSTPLTSSSIPCSYSCNDNSLAAQCVGTTIGDVHCTCTQGPQAQHTFIVNDCDEFLDSIHAQCGPAPVPVTDGGP